MARRTHGGATPNTPAPGTRRGRRSAGAARVRELAAPILDAQWKDFGVHVRAVVEMLGESKFRWNHVQWSLERRLKLRDGALKNAKETAIALAA